MKCKYRKICKGYYPESFTCTQDPSDYCGKFREFNSKDTKRSIIPIKKSSQEVKAITIHMEGLN